MNSFSRLAMLAILAGAFAVAGCPQVAQNATLDFNLGRATLAPLADQPIFETRPIFDRIPGKSGSHAPTICRCAGDELLAAWYSYSGPGELDGAAIFSARRRGGAAEWDAPTELADHADEGDGNPVLYAEGARVWFFQAVATVGWSTARVEWRTSADGGRVWSAAKDLASTPGTNVRSAPIRLASGELILPAYDDLLQRSLFFASSDGANWGRRSEFETSFPDRATQPSIAQLNSGRILAACRNTGQGALWVSASDDDAHSWTPPQDAGFSNPAAAVWLGRLASGRLLLIFNDSQTERHPLSATLSADGGRTWTRARALVNGSGSYAYPSATQTSDGRIHIVYSHDRERIQHITLNEAWLLAGSQ